MLSRPASLKTESMDRFLRSLSAIFVFFIGVPGLAAPGEWERIGESDGVVTLRKEVPDSPVVAFRGEAMIEDSMARIA